MSDAALTLAQWALMAKLYWLAALAVAAIYLLEALLELWLAPSRIDVLDLTDVVELPPPHETAEDLETQSLKDRGLLDVSSQTCPVPWVRSPRRAF